MGGCCLDGLVTGRGEADGQRGQLGLGALIALADDHEARRDQREQLVFAVHQEIGRVEAFAGQGIGRGGDGVRAAVDSDLFERFKAQGTGRPGGQRLVCVGEQGLGIDRECIGRGVLGDIDARLGRRLAARTGRIDPAGRSVVKGEGFGDLVAESGVAIDGPMGRKAVCAEDDRLGHCRAAAIVAVFIVDLDVGAGRGGGEFADIGAEQADGIGLGDRLRRGRRFDKGVGRDRRIMGAGPEQECATQRCQCEPVDHRASSRKPNAVATPSAV